MKLKFFCGQTDESFMKESPSPLKIIDLVVKYNDFTAVKGLNLELKTSEVFGLLGPNGAGKTSTIACLVNLENSFSGQMKIFDHDLKTDLLAAKKLLGYVPQEAVNHGFFSVLEIMSFHSGYYGLNKNQDYILYLLERLGLTEHKQKKVKQLSGGMKRRLMIAKALVHKPKLLLLDEPTAGVDIQLRSSLWDFVRELKNDGVTILLTTHYLEEAEALCDRIGILHQGELLKLGHTKSLIKDLTQRFLKIEFNKPLGSNQMLSQITNQTTKQMTNQILNHKFLFESKDNTFTFKLPSNTKIGDILRDLGEHVAEIEDVHLIEGNLEDAFKIILNQKTSS